MKNPYIYIFIIMKYIITESQYETIREQLEKEVVILPRKKYWNWEELQDYLSTIGNPYHIVRGVLAMDNVEIFDLSKLVEVKGDVVIRKSTVTTLGGLQSVSGYLKVSQSSDLRYLGELESVGGNLSLRESSVRTLNQLKYVGGFLDLYRSKIKSLGELTQVGTDVHLGYTGISNLGELENVGGYLILEATPITSLNKLKTVGDYLNLFGSKIESFGDLEFVGGDLNLEHTPMSEKYSEEDIRSLIEVKGDIKM